MKRRMSKAETDRLRQQVQKTIATGVGYECEIRDNTVVMTIDPQDDPPFCYEELTFKEFIEYYGDELEAEL